MDAVIFIGIPGSGKSTFYIERFVHSHVRINLDMLRTHHREKVLFEACVGAKIPFVIDKTNVTRGQRDRYIEVARRAGFRVHGYFFESRLPDCLSRNAQREGKARIPDKGVRGMRARLELPSLAEGFDDLFHVRIVEGGFSVTPWREGGEA